MANYSGIEYDPNFFRGENEAMVDYMGRLIDAREGGVMGTSQGITPVTQEVTDEPLGEVTQNCPVGYSWDGTRCVPNGSGDSGETPVPTKPTLQQMIDAKTGRSFDGTAIFGLFGPLGTAMAFGAQAARDSALEDALIESGMTPEAAAMAMKDPEYVAQQIYSGRVGDGNIEGVYRPSDAGKWNPVGGIVDSLFGVGGLFGADAVPKNSDYKFAGGGYEYVPAPVLPTASAVTGLGLQQGLLGGMGAEGNRQYYITSDGNVRDVSALQNATQAGLRAVAAGTFDTPSWYEDDGGGTSNVTVGGPIASVPSFEPTTSTSSWSPTVQDAIDYGY
jgi:hypothetical protein